MSGVSKEFVEYSVKRGREAIGKAVVDRLVTTATEADAIMAEHVRPALNPCPCCGERATIDLLIDGLTSTADIYCLSEQCDVGAESIYVHYEELVFVIGKWNKRVEIRG